MKTGAAAGLLVGNACMATLSCTDAAVSSHVRERHLCGFPNQDRLWHDIIPALAGICRQETTMPAFPTSTTVLDSILFRDAFGTPAMREVFSDFSLISRYAEVEVALAKAEARCG